MDEDLAIYIEEKQMQDEYKKYQKQVDELDNSKPTKSSKNQSKSNINGNGSEICMGFFLISIILAIIGF